MASVDEYILISDDDTSMTSYHSSDEADSSPSSSPDPTPDATPDVSIIEQFKVITSDEVVSQMNQVIERVSEILKVKF